MQGGAYARGGDVFAGHYGNHTTSANKGHQNLSCKQLKVGEGNKSKTTINVAGRNQT